MEKNEFGLPPAIFNALTSSMESFYQTTGKALAAAINGPADTRPGPMDPSYPPAMTGAQFLENARAGYGEEGLRGGRIIKDYLLTNRAKRLQAAFATGDRYNISRDLFEALWLLGRITDGKDALDPDDPNPKTPTFIAPFEGIEVFTGLTADQFIKQYWLEKNAGQASG